MSLTKRIDMTLDCGIPAGNTGLIHIHGRREGNHWHVTALPAQDAADAATRDESRRRIYLSAESRQDDTWIFFDREPAGVQWFPCTPLPQYYVTIARLLAECEATGVMVVESDISPGGLRIWADPPALPTRTASDREHGVSFGGFTLEAAACM